MANSIYYGPASAVGSRRRNNAHGGAFAAATAIRLKHELAAALKREAIHAHYQPQYEVATGRCCGVEALARWTLSTGEHVAPSAFIPAAERFGLIQDVGHLMLRNACQTTRPWCVGGDEPLTVSVNVSALQINAAFCRTIEHTLKQFDFPAKQLELEITESALIVDPERTIQYLNEWKTLGVRTAIDDFGTGYSSLNYLTRLPVDRLKIDRSLVQRLTLDRKSTVILRLILAVATELGLDVVAEGVETEHELRMLVELGCPKVQGYLLGRPMPGPEAQIAVTRPWGNRIKPSVGLMAEANSCAAELVLDDDVRREAPQNLRADWCNTMHNPPGARIALR